MTTATMDLPWKDGKRSLWLLGLLVPALPLIGWVFVYYTGVRAFFWLGPVFFYGFISVLEVLVGTDRSNPPESAVAVLERERYYRWCTYLYLPLQYLSLIGGAWLAVRGGLTAFEWVGLVMSIGIVNGVAINTAHELGHKREALERWLSKVALAPTGYGHFYVEHNRGHHVRVATPEDPASARLGESFWAFWPRTVAGSLRSAWELERARLRRDGKPFWSLRNDLLNAWLMTAVLFGALLLWLGPAVLPYLLLQAVFGFSLLEVVNYVEHYGLQRQKDANGRYERCQPQHSWNSNHIVGNVLLYHLQRHSDHHANPTRRYQALRHFEASPQLPSGYASMIVIAYFPPLWRRLMDDRVVRHYGGDVRRASIQPSKRERYLQRYAQPAAAAEGATRG